MKKIITILCIFSCHFIVEAKSPNIIYILADDLGMGDLSCYGQEKLKTPNIDRIALEGMQFSRHYSGSTVCAPSRCALMTGLHTGHSAIRGNLKSPITPKDGNMHMPEGTYTLARLFKDNGYKAGIFGKWGLGANESPTSPLKVGFDKFYGYIDQGIAHNYFPEYMWDNDKKVKFPENLKNAKGVYSADLIQGEVLKYIDENKDKPFFIYYATTLPHASMESIEKYQEQFRGKFLPEKSFKGSAGYTPQPESYAAFAAMIYTLDLYIAQIFDKLESEGLLDDTIIIFTSDNGAHAEGGHNPEYWNSTADMRGIKRDLYEGGIRTPMLLYWKGRVAAGTKTSHISAFWDILPTFADILEVEAPKGLDGISFLPTLLSKEGQKEHKYLYWEFLMKEGKQAVLKGDWKLIKLDANNPRTIKYELYDLKADKRERHNLYEKNPEIANELKSIMESARTPYSIKKI